jgi:subtilase family serine protease
VRALSVATASCAVLAGVALPGVTAAPAEAASPRVVVRDTHPKWATPDTEVAKAPASKTIKARVYFTPRDQSALDKAVAAVSTPGSPSYGKYITPQQFRQQYGASPGSISKVTSWLRSAGLSVSAPQLNDRYVEVSGSVGSAQRAFGTGLSLYRKSGGTYQAPAGAVTVPSDVSAEVLSVTGLDESPARMTPQTVTGTASAAAKQAAATPGASPYPLGFRNAPPCSSYYGQLKATKLPTWRGKTRAYAVCGYTPTQLRGAYGVPKQLTGKGVTVAIIDAYLSPTLLSDVNQWSRNHGVPVFRSGQFRALTPGAGYHDQGLCDAPSWSGEQALDVEAVHGMAPDANVLYVAGSSCSALDLFSAEAAVVDSNLASIISLSYGDVEGTESAGEAAIDTLLFKQAALQGIGFYIASGDNGDELANTGLKQVDSSASNPYATAVGGTSVGIGPFRGGQYWFESGWGTTRLSLSADRTGWVDREFYGGAGGGHSELFGKPSYQRGFVPGGARGVPDVAMDADPTTGMKVGVTQQFPEGIKYAEYRVGGTSLAAPLFAGVQALTSQAQNRRLGFANPRLYALSRSQPKAFHDVTNAFDHLANVRVDYEDDLSARSGLVYSLRTFGDDSSLWTAKGWDPVTGVGSPTAAYYWAR